MPVQYVQGGGVFDGAAYPGLELKYRWYRGTEPVTAAAAEDKQRLQFPIAVSSKVASLQLTPDNFSGNAVHRMLFGQRHIGGDGAGR